MKPEPLLAALLLASCAASNPPALEHEPPRNEVIVLGMIHDGHETSDAYGIDDVRAIVIAVQPDFVLAEIPPDRLEQARNEFLATGVIEEPRVRRFPEYVQAVFPLLLELDFEIVPCAAWTRGMADERGARLERWKTERPEDSAAVEDGMASIEVTLAAIGLDGTDPRDIHTSAYDEIVEAGLEPYDRLFNADLGPGGWDNINRAHYVLIEAALQSHPPVEGAPVRFLITFGAWHKYWFLNELRQRDDIVVRELSEFY